MSNMNKMLKQVQKMQEEMEKAKQKLNLLEVSHSAGGGAVTVTVNGQQELVDLKISPQAIGNSQEDIEMLEEMIISAVNGALEESLRLAQEEMAKAAGIGGIPGLM